MDSGSGSSIVELGRFMTGFLVVMGVGTYHTLKGLFGRLDVLANEVSV